MAVVRRTAKRDPEEMLQTALELLRDQYHKDIERSARDFIDYNERDMDREDFLTRIHEYVDGNRYVIITWMAQVTALVSENDARSLQDGLADPSSWKDGIEWSQLAYGAFEADLIEALVRLGVEPNDDHPLENAKRSRKRK